MSSVLPGDPVSFAASADTEDRDDGVLLAELCDDFTNRTRDGERPTVAEYTAAYPELAEQIASVFPALMMFGNLGESLHSAGDAEPAPTEIAGYKIIRRLGIGGMGVVYEATHPTVSRRMAIKVLKPQKANAGKFQERFLREAEAASRLNHPNIVPFLDCGKDGETAYLSMHFVDGQSLDHLLAQCWEGDLCDDVSSLAKTSSWIAKDFQRIAKLGANVASAVQQAHSQGTIHRDIKPANLILDTDDKIWVTDFGLAKLRGEESDLSQTGDLIGTPRYMAPEQIRGLADERSDIYGLGVTLYELASGHRAWGTTKQRDLLGAQSAFELPEISDLHPDVPQGLADIIMKAVAHDPERRYQSAVELEHVLNQFAHGKSISDRRIRGQVAKPLRLLRPEFVLAGIAGVFFAQVLDQNPAALPANISVAETTSTNSHECVIASESQRFEVTDGGSMARTVMPTMGLHTGLVMWWMIGGDDAKLFDIDRSRGILKPHEPLTFSNPQDSDGNNVDQLRIGMKSSTMMEETDVDVVVKQR